MTLKAFTDYFNAYPEMPEGITIVLGNQQVVTNNFTQFFSELPVIHLSSMVEVPVYISLSHMTMQPVSSPDSYLSMSIKQEPRLQQLTIRGKPIERGYRFNDFKTQNMVDKLFDEQKYKKVII